MLVSCGNASLYMKSSPPRGTPVAMRCDLIGGFIDEIGADQIGDLLLQLFGNQDAPAERFVARVGEGKIRLHRRARRPIPPARRGCRRGSPPRPWRAACRSRACRRGPLPAGAAASIRKPPPWPLGRLRDQEIRGDLALRRQQRAEPAKARPQQRDVGGDEAVEEVAGILAADLDHAPVGKKRCFHALKRPILEVL